MGNKPSNKLLNRTLRAGAPRAVSSNVRAKNTDIYSTFAELKSAEQEGEAFRVVIRKQEKIKTVIIAPHGGGIEQGTSEIAEKLADKDLSLAMFEGIKRNANRELHITSTNFDEPRCLSIVTCPQ